MIYAFTASTTVPFNIKASTWHFSKLAVKFHYVYFTNLFLAAFPRPKELRYTPLGVNFATSAHLTALKKIDATLIRFYDTSKVLPNTYSRITYPYATNLTIVLTSISKNYLYDLVYRFLRLSLHVWFFWPGTYKVKAHHTVVSTHWWKLNFLNEYYFRMFAI